MLDCHVDLIALASPKRRRRTRRWRRVYSPAYEAARTPSLKWQKSCLYRGGPGWRIRRKRKVNEAQQNETKRNKKKQNNKKQNKKKQKEIKRTKKK